MFFFFFLPQICTRLPLFASAPVESLVFNKSGWRRYATSCKSFTQNPQIHLLLTNVTGVSSLLCKQVMWVNATSKITGALKATGLTFPKCFGDIKLEDKGSGSSTEARRATEPRAGNERANTQTRPGMKAFGWVQTLWSHSSALQTFYEVSAAKKKKKKEKEKEEKKKQARQMPRAKQHGNISHNFHHPTHSQYKAFVKRYRQRVDYINFPCRVTKDNLLICLKAS